MVCPAGDSSVKQQQRLRQGVCSVRGIFCYSLRRGTGAAAHCFFIAHLFPAVRVVLLCLCVREKKCVFVCFAAAVHDDRRPD